MCQTPGDRRGGRPCRTPWGIPRYPLGAGIPVLARARADGSPGAVAAAQDRVFQRFLPLARAVAAGAVPAGGPADPGAAERAAESGLARAVARWWSADGAGFDVFACITIAVELDRLSAAASDGPVTGVADRCDDPPRTTRANERYRNVAARDGPRRGGEPVTWRSTSMFCDGRDSKVWGGRLRAASKANPGLLGARDAPRRRPAQMCRTNPGVACRTTAADTLPRITRRRTRPSTAAREDFCTPSSGIAHVPGQAWTRNRLAHTKGSRSVRIMQGQDPVGEVRSYTVVPADGRGSVVSLDPGLDLRAGAGRPAGSPPGAPAANRRPSLRR